MTSLDIQRALCGYWDVNLWNPRKVLAVRNSTGVAGWDADLLIIHPSGWADEIEIKVSLSDFKREFTKKAHKHRSLQEGLPDFNLVGWKAVDDWTKCKPHIVRRFWFAVPSELADKVRPLVPRYAGLITVEPGRHCGVPRKVLKAPQLKMARQLTPEEQRAAIDSVYYRYWSIEHDEGWKLLRGAA